MEKYDIPPPPHPLPNLINMTVGKLTLFEIKAMYKMCAYYLEELKKLGLKVFKLVPKNYIISFTFLFSMGQIPLLKPAFKDFLPLSHNSFNNEWIWVDVGVSRRKGEL